MSKCFLTLYNTFVIFDKVRTVLGSLWNLRVFFKLFDGFWNLTNCEMLKFTLSISKTILEICHWNFTTYAYHLYLEIHFVPIRKNKVETDFQTLYKHWGVHKLLDRNWCIFNARRWSLKVMLEVTIKFRLLFLISIYIWKGVFLSLRSLKRLGKVFECLFFLKWVRTPI